AARRDRVDRALEGVEHVLVAVDGDLHRLVVLVAAYLAARHTDQLPFSFSTGTLLPGASGGHAGGFGSAGPRGARGARAGAFGAAGFAAVDRRVAGLAAPALALAFAAVGPAVGLAARAAGLAAARRGAAVAAGASVGRRRSISSASDRSSVAALRAV